MALAMAEMPERPLRPENMNVPNVIDQQLAALEKALEFQLRETICGVRRQMEIVWVETVETQRCLRAESGRHAAGDGKHHLTSSAPFGVAVCAPLATKFSCDTDVGLPDVMAHDVLPDAKPASQGGVPDAPNHSVVKDHTVVKVNKNDDLEAVQSGGILTASTSSKRAKMDLPGTSRLSSNSAGHGAAIADRPSCNSVITELTAVPSSRSQGTAWLNVSPSVGHEKEPQKECRTSWTAHLKIGNPMAAIRQGMKVQGHHSETDPTSSAGEGRPSWQAMGSRHSITKKREKKACFADVSRMKDEVRQTLAKKTYNVCDFYHSKGIAQCIARSALFDSFTLFVIAVNALYISIDTDFNHSAVLTEADFGFQVAEHSFCSYFTFEWVTRFLAFKHKRDGLQDKWFVFDGTLVSLMVSETWLMTLFFWITDSDGSGGQVKNASILRLVRLLRLSRMARMARLIRLIPEIIILIKGMMVAFRSVMFTLFLLLAIVYVFAVAFVQLSGPGTVVGDLHFRDVGAAMTTLLLQATLPDAAPVVYDTGRENLALGLLMMIFLLLTSLTVMNMLIGVLVEIVSVVSSVEKEQINIMYVKTHLQDMLEEMGIDVDKVDVVLTPEVIQDLLAQPEAARIINSVGVDVVGLIDFCIFLFKSRDSIEFSSFVEIVLQLRGANTATVKDVVDLRKLVVNDLFHELESIEERITSQLVKIEKDALLLGTRSVSADRGGRIDRGPMALASGDDSASTLIDWCDSAKRCNSLEAKHSHQISVSISEPANTGAYVASHSLNSHYENAGGCLSTVADASGATAAADGGSELSSPPPPPALVHTESGESVSDYLEAMGEVQTLSEASPGQRRTEEQQEALIPLPPPRPSPPRPPSPRTGHAAWNSPTALELDGASAALAPSQSREVPQGATNPVDGSPSLGVEVPPRQTRAALALVAARESLN